MLSSGVSIELSDLRSSTTAWARSWLFQKLGSDICASISLMRDFLVSQSKRVSQLQNALADGFGAIDEFFFHA
jgi:hypothetical protein